MFYSTGINQYNVSKRLTSDNFYSSLHAEVDAIQKLPINKSKKKIKINVFVFRISRSKNHNDPGSKSSLIEVFDSEVLASKKTRQIVANDFPIDSTSYSGKYRNDTISVRKFNIPTGRL